MKVRILRPALDDLAADRQFYDRQQEGVGEYFIDSIFGEIDSLVLHAGIHHKQFGYHRLLVRRFPYAVYYRIVGSEAVVHRVLDCRRDPKWLHRALSQMGETLSSPRGQ